MSDNVCGGMDPMAGLLWGAVGEAGMRMLLHVIIMYEYAGLVYEFAKS